MQQTKITDNLGEFQIFLDNDSKTGMCLEDTIGFFDVRRIFGQFETIKQSGIRVSRIMTTLLVMLFYRSRNIYSYFSRQYGQQIDKEGSKNPYYDMLGNEYVPWRVILYLFAKRYLHLVSRLADHSKQMIRALIFDDSPVEKTGLKIEGTSKIHDHVTGRYILGFKLLVSGYWDGNNFIPIDFSLHRERGKELDKARKKRNRARRKAKQAEAAYKEHKVQHLKKRAVLNSLKEMDPGSTKSAVLEYEKQKKRVSRSKKKQSRLRKQMKQARAILAEKEEIVRQKEKQAPLYGLTPTQQRNQFKKERAKDSQGYERRSEADMSKAQSVIRMISRAVKRGFEFEYVLFDSWFFSKEILARIESFRTKGIKLVAMVKMGKNLYRDCLSEKEMDANTLKKFYKKKGKAQRSRKYNATYIRVPVWYDNRRVNLFFVRLGSGSKWKVFITNDLDLTFTKLLEVYHIRWSIEVFFKDGKQHLQLGKCQCNNFDSQIGATTLAMMQYIMLLLYKQQHYGQSLGSIFDMLSTQTQEENITRYLMDIFWEIVHGIGEILKVDIMELFEEIIRDHHKAEEITRLFLPVFEKKRAA